MKTNLKDTALDILGEAHFNLVYNFFYDIIIDEEKKHIDFDYIIFKARRSFVLYEIFIEIFSEEYDETDKNAFKNEYASVLKKVHNDASFGGVDFRYKNQSNNNKTEEQAKEQAKILFVDDILIHGRTLSKMLDDIPGFDNFDYNSPEMVNNFRQITKAFVFLKRKDAECIKPKLKAVLNTYVAEECDDETWRTYSNSFVNLIQQSGFCYSSFAPQFKLNKTNIDFKLKSYIPVRESVLHISGLKTKIYYSYNENDIYSFIREYTYSSGEILLVPFVILRSYEIEHWKIIYKNFCEKLISCGLVNAEGASTTLAQFLTEDNSKSYEYSYRFVTYVMSVLFIFNSLENKKDVIEEANGYFKRCTFGDKINLIIENIYNNYLKSSFSYQDFLDVFKHENEESLLDFENDIDDFSIQNIKDKSYGCSTNSFAETYINQLHDINEIRAKNEQERCYGFNAFYIVSTLYPNQPDLQCKLLCEFITKWDSGKSTYIPKIAYSVNGKKFLSGNISDGEQAYHETLGWDCIDAINCFYDIYRLSNKDISSAIDKFSRFRVFCKKNTNLDTKVVDAVYNYINKNKSFKELKNIYFEKGLSDAWAEAFINFAGSDRTGS